MTSPEATTLGISTPGTKDTLAGEPICDWKVSGSFGVQVGVSADEGISDLNLGGKTPTTLALPKHKAGKLPDGSSSLADSGTCTVLIEVSSSSHVSVDVSTVGGRGTEMACQRAEQVAKFIDPKLP
jgi:hypothetical protein